MQIFFVHINRTAWADDTHVSAFTEELTLAFEVIYFGGFSRKLYLIEKALNFLQFIW